MRQWLHERWKRHGTKILGFGATAVGFIAFVDQATIQLVASLFGPKYSPFVFKSLLVCVGLAVAHRGFHNSKGPPPQ